MARFLNLGCGSRFCSNSCWTNVDFVSTSSQVIAHDLLKGIPFEENTFDVVYHSNILEHFNRVDGENFIKECSRVLKGAGTIRVVVPDLEGICRFYLFALDKIKAGDIEFRRQYDWILLELYDQTVRTESGGEMYKHLIQLDPHDREFVISRIGSVGKECVVMPLDIPVSSTNTDKTLPAWNRFTRKIKHNRLRFRDFVKSKVLTKHEHNALSLGLFRLSGEIHQWMYDEYSLRTLLSDSGFENIRRYAANSSRIENWNEYFLDVDPNGFEHAPSALFMEGTKPT